MSGSQWYNLNIYLSICYNGIDVVFFSKIVNENEWKVNEELETLPSL